MPFVKRQFSHFFWDEPLMDSAFIHYFYQFPIVMGIFYWVEAKTGDFQQHISKYSKMSKRIGIDYKHSIMVLTDIQPEKSSALTSFLI